MGREYFLRFAHRCRDLAMRARTEVARKQLFLWADEFEARAEEATPGQNARPLATPLSDRPEVPCPDREASR